MEIICWYKINFKSILQHLIKLLLSITIGYFCSTLLFTCPSWKLNACNRTCIVGSLVAKNLWDTTCNRLCNCSRNQTDNNNSDTRRYVLIQIWCMFLNRSNNWFCRILDSSFSYLGISSFRVSYSKLLGTVTRLKVYLTASKRYLLVFMSFF